jgi:TolB-like protein/Flp pilus assembly protein TadD
VAEVVEIDEAGNDLVVAERRRSHIVIDESHDGSAIGQAAPAKALAGGGGLKRKTLLLTSISLAALVGLIVAVYFWVTSKPAEIEPALAVKSIAVLPFKPLDGKTEDDYLGLGMADSLITKLGNLKQVIVRPTSAVLKYGDTGADALDAGREQGVDALLIGKIQRAEDRVRVSVQLVRVSDGVTLWGREFNESFTNIFAVQDLISANIVKSLRLSLTGEEQRKLTGRHPSDIEAYQFYLQGRYFWNKRSKEGLQKAIYYFERAIDKDPGYALAYAGLADSYYVLGFRRLLPQQEAYSQAKRAATKALRIDDNIVEAHTSLARIMDNYEQSPLGGEQEYRRAIEINPNYPTARHWYSRHLLQRGRIDESLAEAKKAHELDPLSLIINANLGEISYYARQYDEALKHLRNTQEMDPSFRKAFVSIFLFFTYMRKGMYDEAAVEFAKALFSENPNPEKEAHAAAALRDAYRDAGEKGIAQKQIELVKKEAQKHPDFHIHLAEAYARLGDMDQAFYWLKKAADENHPAISLLHIDPDFDSLRMDPRFQELAPKGGFAR